MKWRVFINNKGTGIIETNYPYASVYWAKRAQILDAKIKLIKENQ